jgi:hypothetical protein
VFCQQGIGAVAHTRSVTTAAAIDSSFISILHAVNTTDAHIGARAAAVHARLVNAALRMVVFFVFKREMSARVCLHVITAHDRPIHRSTLAR